MFFLDFSTLHGPINKMPTAHTITPSSLRPLPLSFLVSVLVIVMGSFRVNRMRVLQLSAMISLLVLVLEFGNFRWFEICNAFDRRLSLSLNQIVFVLEFSWGVGGLIMMTLLGVGRLRTNLIENYLYIPPIFCADI